MEMYKLILDAKECVSCGICFDVCRPCALNMRMYKGSALEGYHLIHVELNNNYNKEQSPAKMMTFPFLELPELCNGCSECVNECPTSAIGIQIAHPVRSKGLLATK